MEKGLPPYDQLVEEDYIDMDISSATFLCYTISSSPQHSKEFEFQMSANPPERHPTNSPADELFYKGKLLPLHLPPRLQMVKNILESSYTSPHVESLDIFDESFATSANDKTAATTPFESCNISPTASCYVSGELDPEDYLLNDCSARLVQPIQKKSWSKKLKLKQSSLGLKLKASRAYLKSLFTKSGCSDQSCAVPKAKECSNGYSKAGKKNPFGQIHRERSNNGSTLMKALDREKAVEEQCAHRRSFSGAIKRHSKDKSPSSASSSCSSSNSSSFSSASSYGTPVLKRSSSVNSEVESSIQGAIAYCKKSQQLVCARKSVSDVECVPLSDSKTAADSEKQERPGICRG